MNKARRHELKMLKYKRRLNIYKVRDDLYANLYAFRSHGKPCSCCCCSPYERKYKRAKVKEAFYIEARPMEEPVVLHNFTTNERGELVKVF